MRTPLAPVADSTAALLLRGGMESLDEPTFQIDSMSWAVATDDRKGLGEIEAYATVIPALLGLGLLLVGDIITDILQVGVAFEVGLIVLVGVFAFELLASGKQITLTSEAPGDE